MLVISGEQIFMPCDISTDSDDAVVLVLWYREDLGTPIYRWVAPARRVILFISSNMEWKFGRARRAHLWKNGQIERTRGAPASFYYIPAPFP